MILNDIIKLTKSLYPTGRAWRIPYAGVFYKVVEGLAESELRAINFALSILSRILPDNNNFTAEDATEWERRLGLVVLPYYISLSTRKDIILRKYQFPGSFLNRQNYRYIEYQLRLAGFDVYIYENLGGTIDILDTFMVQHADNTEHGIDTEMGGTYIDLIANSHLYGEAFDLPDAKGVFYIAGASISTPASISPSLRESFRKLVLALKPANTIAVLNIDWINDNNLTTVSGDDFYAVDGDKLQTMN